MVGRHVVPLPLGGEVSEDGGVEPPHPVVGVRTAQAVRDVVVRFLGRGRRAGRGRHGRHRTPALTAAALLVPSVLVGAVLGAPGPARATSADDPLTFDDFLWDPHTLEVSSLGLRERIGYLWIWLRGKAG